MAEARAAAPVVRVGSRTSALARWQTGQVLAGLGRAGVAARFAGVRTAGDRDRRPSALARGDGVFVAALESALLDGRIDVAVHSLKDMPTRLAPGLEIAAVLARHDARDAVVGRPLGRLAMGARVGTASPRRRAFVRALWPGLDVVAVRGNVPTRVALVADGAVDSVVLALAGLERLGMAGRVAQVLPIDAFPPAAGQGAIAVEVRAGDAPPGVAALDDPVARRATAAERALLAALGGSCDLPLGAYAEVLDDGRLRLRARLAGADGRLLSADIAGAPDDEVVRRAASELGRS